MSELALQWENGQCETTAERFGVRPMRVALHRPDDLTSRIRLDKVDFGTWRGFTLFAGHRPKGARRLMPLDLRPDF
jgi:hypothetical protein